MLRRLITPAFTLGVLLAIQPLSAQIWPEQWREHTRTRVEPVPIAEPGLWAEYEGEASERASYNGPIGLFHSTAWRLADTTSALAWYQAIRPANCTPARDSSTLCTTPGAQVMAHMNYVLMFEGWRPLARELTALYAVLPGLRSGGGMPNLPGYLPEKDRVRNSERYILGVQSLSKFEPRISPILAGFEDGAEAILARFQTPGGEVALTLFDYPTPQLARLRLPEFEKQAGFIVKRSGPLVAVIPGGAAPANISSLLESIEWDVNFIWNEATKPPPIPDVGGMLLAIFELTGLLLVICIGGGFAFAGLWVFLRKRQHRIEGSEGTITVLHIEDR